ncbi:MAG TPA: DUF2254 family protein [Burkholderiales bacterium]
MRRLRELALSVRESFWLVPSIAFVVAVLLGAGLVELDATLDADLAGRWPRLFGAGAEGARGTLAAIAGSMITVAGVVFSVTIVALSLPASAYSPRVLSAFMHDRRTQAAFGEREWRAVPARRSGYILSVDSSGLLAFARRATRGALGAPAPCRAHERASRGDRGAAAGVRRPAGKRSAPRGRA